MERPVTRTENSLPADPKPAVARGYDLIGDRYGRRTIESADRSRSKYERALIEGSSAESSLLNLGCGNGYHSLELAKRVGPEGRVIGVDIQPEMLDLLKVRAREQGIRNVDLIVGEIHDPRLEKESCDLILMADVYHELSHPAEVLALLRSALKPGGRVVALEFRGEDPAVPIKPKHKMTKAQVVAEFTANGFEKCSPPVALDEPGRLIAEAAISAP